MLKGDYIYFKFKNLILLYWKIAIFYDHVSDHPIQKNMPLVTEKHN
jgi:hypothetical protein